MSLTSGRRPALVGSVWGAAGPSAANRRARSREPLLRNGHLLSASSVLTSVLGAAYWALATRFYPVNTVGRNYAAISAMLFLAGVGQLNLTNVLVRFVPVAGGRTGRLVAQAYAAAFGITLLLAVGFVLLLPDISPGLDFLHHPLVGAGFAVATAGYALFVLQDGALTGLRRAGWVVLENAVFAGAKIVGVVLLALLIRGNGILLSWALALIVAVVLTNAFLFGRAIPRHERAAPDAAGSGRPAPTPEYIMCDYIGALFWIAATTLPPLIVLQRLGADEAAYFSLTWVIAYTLYLLSANMGSSLIVESATAPGRLARNCRRVLAHTGMLLVGCVLVLTAAAPLVLRVFGADYARHGTGLLRLLLLSALPNLVVAVAVSVCRARRRMKTVIAILAAVCSLALVLMVVLLPVLGLTGAGAAWLIAQSAVAAVLVWRRSWWLGPAADGATVARRTPAALARTGAEALDRAVVLPGHRRLGRRLSREAQPGSGRPESRVSRTASDILLVHSRGTADLAVKYPINARARAALEQQYKTLRALEADERLGDFRRLLPTVVLSEVRGDRPRAVEQWLPGVDASTLVHGRPDAERQVTATALAAIAGLHRATGRIETVGADHLRRWIDAPLAVSRRELDVLRTAWGVAATDALRERLYDGFMGRRILVAWTHGDYHPGNVIVDADCARVTGIVDWATALRDGPAPVDSRLFALTMRREVDGCELGDLVVREHRREVGADGPGTCRAAAGFTTGGSATVDPDALLLLTWLRHIADNAAKSMRYNRSRRWQNRNVLPVLREVTG
jgi:O-antigen/teichoic acid export membrane protein